MAFLFPLLLLLFLAPGPSSCRHTSSSPESVEPQEFARIVHLLSEEGGYFWSNNYISNETSYLHPLETLSELGVAGGVYVGVGPNQNFSYIAAIRPERAYIVDIRRDNMLEHLLFKLLMEKADTRQKYLSLLTGRPLVGAPLPHTASLETIVESIETAERDEDFFRAELQSVTDRLEDWPDLALSAVDLHDLERIYYEFFIQGLEIKYDNWRSFFFPSLKEFLLQTDQDRNRRNWLTSPDAYDFVRNLQLSNGIIPAVGDFAGDTAFRRLGRLLREQGKTVSAVYVSNVEFYLFRQKRWDRFVENLRHLPIDEGSVFIRAYANLHRPHPLMVGNHITVSLVQNIQKFLDNADRGFYRSLWDVVTTDYQ